MFEWKDEYSVQIPSIDAQHRNLFRIGAELNEAMRTGQGKAVLSKTLDRLVQYTVVHFDTEERLMRQHGYPELAAHKAEHDALTTKVKEFQAELESGRALITVQLLQFVRDWLDHHIQGSDQKYAPYLRQRAVA